MKMIKITGPVSMNNKRSHTHQKALSAVYIVVCLRAEAIVHILAHRHSPVIGPVGSNGPITGTPEALLRRPDRDQRHSAQTNRGSDLHLG